MSNEKTVDISPSDFLRGGDSAVRAVEVPGLKVGGVQARIYHRSVSAATMIDFQAGTIEAQEIEKAGGNPRHIERMAEFLAKHICDKDGKLLYSDEQLKQAPVDQLTNTLKAVTGQLGQEEVPNPSSGSEVATTSGSRTESQPS